MKIALIGATGFIGSRLLAELTSRGHQVTAIVRNPEKVPQGAGITALKGDVYDKDGLAALLAGHDAVISAEGERKLQSSAVSAFSRSRKSPPFLASLR